jgi:hypothetical protein
MHLLNLEVVKNFFFLNYVPQRHIPSLLPNDVHLEEIRGVSAESKYIV